MLSFNREPNQSINVLSSLSLPPGKIAKTIFARTAGRSRGVQRWAGAGRAEERWGDCEVHGRRIVRESACILWCVFATRERGWVSDEEKGDEAGGGVH